MADNNETLVFYREDSSGREIRMTKPDNIYIEAYSCNI